MTLKQALKRIEELERKVKELEVRPQTQYHYHYGYQGPVYQPFVQVQPVQQVPYITSFTHGTTGLFGGD